MSALLTILEQDRTYGIIAAVAGMEVMMAKLISLIVLSIAVFGCIVVQADCAEDKSEPGLALRANFSETRIQIGNELRPMVSLLNTSNKNIKLEFMRPSIVVPQIWDETGTQRIPNAPTFVYDQICAMQETVLAPKQALDLFSMPIVLVATSPANIRSDHLQAFWVTKPGKYRLRYSVQLNDFRPGKKGELKSDDIEIAVLGANSGNAQNLLEVISNAKAFETEFVGEGGKSAAYAAYAELIYSNKDPIEKIMKQIKAASPAGKLYLAALVRELDSRQGIVALNGLMADESKTRFQSGCKGTQVKVNEVAKALLENGQFLTFRLRARCKT